MSRLQVVKVWLGWFLFAVVAATIPIVVWQPMAGLFFAIVLCAFALMIGGPIVHLGANRLFFAGSNKYWWLIAALIIFITLAIFFVAVNGGLLGGT